jgi:hypothetical protein
MKEEEETTNDNDRNNDSLFTPPEGANVQLEIDRQYSNFKLIRKEDELDDENFPKSLHNVAELFVRLQMIDHVSQMHKCVETFKKILENGPDGKQTNGLGQAILCFNCGFVGLPKGGDIGMECSSCREEEQTNKIIVKQPDGTIVPWIESKIAPDGKGKNDAQEALEKKLEEEDDDGRKK